MATLTSVEGNRVFWCDSDGLHSSHAVSLRTAKVPYIVTRDDVLRNWALVHIQWSVPFEDGNYTCAWSIEDPGLTPDLDYSTGDIHNKTPQGFDAVFYLNAPGFGAVGETIYINASGFHV